ncbi:hypothetical protein ACSSS7_007040 [Eimeria intestinalis]
MASLFRGLAVRQAASVAAAAARAAAVACSNSGRMHVGSSTLSVGCGASRLSGHAAISKACLSNVPFDPSAASAAHAAAAATAATPLGALPVPPLNARAVTSPGNAGAKGSKGDVQQQQQQQKEGEQRELRQQVLCLSDDAASAAALSAYTTPELYRALLVYALCACKGLVENSEKLVLLCSKLLGSRLTSSALRHTFFKVFCGGEDLAELTRTLDRLQQRNLGAVLDFAAEQPVPTAGLLATKAAAAAPTASGQTSAAADPYEAVVRRTRETISVASDRGGGYAAMKVSAIGHPDAMQRFNSLLFHIDRVFGILAEMQLTLLLLLLLLVLDAADNAAAAAARHASDAAADVAGLEPQAVTGRPSPEGLAAAAVSRQQFVSALARLHVDLNHADALFEHLVQQPGGESSSDSNNSSARKAKVSYFQWTHRVTPETAGHVGPMRCLSKVLPVLHPEDLASYKATHARFHSLCDFARRQQNPPMLLVDAEQSTVQTYIHALALEAQKQYNTETPAVGSTYQAYLKQAHNDSAAAAAAAAACRLDSSAAAVVKFRPKQSLRQHQLKGRSHSERGISKTTSRRFRGETVGSRSLQLGFSYPYWRIGT